MKRKVVLIWAFAVLLGSHSARATLYTETFTPGTTIPVGNPVGVTISGSVSDIASGLAVTGLTLSLNVSGGYNGGLFAYLVAPNGTQVTLMNEPGLLVNGIGASGSGMNITLQDGASDHGSIQNETGSGVLTGSYNAAGSLSAFNGSPADGTWTLFFADETSGGGSATLNSWSLGITTVPEPVSVALGIFGGVLMLIAVIGSFRTRLGNPALQRRLVQSKPGRVLLHAGCLLRGGRWSFHWAGIRREIRGCFRTLDSGRKWARTI